MQESREVNAESNSVESVRGERDAHSQNSSTPAMLGSEIPYVEQIAFGQFVRTIAALRAKDGCPWDKVQTHESISRNMLEEAYEAVDAIEKKDTAMLREELGDVLLEVVMQCQIAADAGEFTIEDVCADINEKMIRRHPHVFGQASADDANDVLELWDQVKQQERENSQKEAPKPLLNSVGAGFPALMQAQKISKKAVSVGFEWDSVDAVWKQVEEEIAELKEAYDHAPKTAKGKIDQDEYRELYDNAQLELGDVFFSLVNVARKMGLDSESALRATCVKFRKRFAYIEEQAWALGKTLEDLSTQEMEAYWQESKRYFH